jgi:hypothetical protein
MLPPGLGNGLGLRKCLLVKVSLMTTSSLCDSPNIDDESLADCGIEKEPEMGVAVSLLGGAEVELRLTVIDSSGKNPSRVALGTELVVTPEE